MKPTPEPRKFHWPALVMCCMAAALAWVWYSGQMVVPPAFNPWAALDVMARPNLLTNYKMAKARNNPLLCQQALAQTGMVYDRVPDRVTGPGCGFSHAVRLRQAGVRLGTPLLLSCPAALSFFMWEHHALQPAAQRYFKQRVASIEHLGSYACRNINRGQRDADNTSSGPRSRHATADALDVAGFTLEDGQRITVLKDWQPEPASKPAQMLAQVHQGACQFFNGVLGPDYNAVHQNHFHLETGGYAMCR